MHFVLKLIVIFTHFFTDAIMTSAGTEYPMGPLGPPPTGTSGQPGTFPRGAKKNQCESSPSFTSLSSASSPPLSESSSSLSSSNDSIVQVASDNAAATGNGYRQRAAGSTSDSFRDLNKRPRTPQPPRGSSSQTSGSSTGGGGGLPTVIHQKHNNTKAVTATNSNTNNALDIVQDEVESGVDPNDLQTLSIVASGSVFTTSSFLFCCSKKNPEF